MTSRSIHCFIRPRLAAGGAALLATLALAAPAGAAGTTTSVQSTALNYSFSSGNTSTDLGESLEFHFVRGT